VGLRAALLRVLSNGPPRQPVNEDALVELITVPLFEGPLLVAHLRSNGIDAKAVDSFNVVTKIASDSQIFVRRGDLDSARVVVASLSWDESE
jgi:hypothetical protein